jgi:hypothetical protein
MPGASKLENTKQSGLDLVAFYRKNGSSQRGRTAARGAEAACEKVWSRQMIGPDPIPYPQFGLRPVPALS